MIARRCRRTLLATAVSLAFALSHAATAAPEGPTNDEIAHLLDFVAASSCKFVRNGTEYPGDKARQHLAGKYRFAGGRIATAEEFIEQLATQSSASGEAYHVKCGKSDALSGVWLTDELDRYRKAPRVRTTR